MLALALVAVVLAVLTTSFALVDVRAHHRLTEQQQQLATATSQQQALQRQVLSMKQSQTTLTAQVTDLKQRLDGATGDLSKSQDLNVELVHVVKELNTCSTGITNVLKSVSEGNYPAASALYSETAPLCEQAQADASAVAQATGS